MMLTLNDFAECTTPSLLLILALDNFVVCLSITSSSLSQSVVYYEKIIAYSY